MKERIQEFPGALRLTVTPTDENDLGDLSGVQPITQAEMTKAMSSPEYRSNPDFRREIARRVAVS
jgi:hypothetical protein